MRAINTAAKSSLRVMKTPPPAFYVLLQHLHGIFTREKLRRIQVSPLLSRTMLEGDGFAQSVSYLPVRVDERLAPDPVPFRCEGGAGEHLPCFQQGIDTTSGTSVGDEQNHLSG